MSPIGVANRLSRLSDEALSAGPSEAASRGGRTAPTLSARRRRRPWPSPAYRHGLRQRRRRLRCKPDRSRATASARSRTPSRAVPGRDDPGRCQARQRAQPRLRTARTSATSTSANACVPTPTRSTPHDVIASCGWSKHPARIHVGVGGWVYEPWRETFYPPGLAKARRARLPEPPRHRDRDQRHLLPHAKRRELRQVARRGTARLRLRRQGHALRDQPPRARGSGRIDRAIRAQAAWPNSGPSSGRSSGSSRPPRPSTPTISVPSSHCCRRRVGALPLRHAMEVRHPSFMCADYLALARRHGVATVFADSDDYPSFADATADFVYARLMRSESRNESGYNAERDRRLGRGGTPVGGRRRARRPASRRGRPPTSARRATCSCSSSAAPRSALRPRQWRRSPRWDSRRDTGPQ